MLDTPPLRKRRGPWPVKGRWAGKIFSSSRLARTQNLFRTAKKVRKEEMKRIYTQIWAYIYVCIHATRSRRIFLTRFVRNPSPVFRVLVSGRIFASAKY